MKVEHLNTRKLHDISFTLNQGEILGLVGLVGAGRTEIVRALYGADKAKRKKIEMQGREIKITSPQDGKKNGMAFVPEDRKKGSFCQENGSRGWQMKRLKNF